MVARAGFTLLEALIAITISSVLVILMAQVFLAQNQFYSNAVARNLADDAARTASEFLAAALKNGHRGGITVASERQLVVRSTLAVGAVCHETGANKRLYMPGISTAETSEVGGYAVRDSIGVWSYTGRSWAALLRDIGANPAAACESAGVDTTGALDDFVEITTNAPDIGDLVMVYSELQYEIAPSSLDPGMLGIYRGRSDATGVELATGLMSETRFEYLVGSTWHTNPPGIQFDSISEIRVTLRAAGSGDSTSTDGYSTTISFRVPLQGG